jgi:hypothetical protein
VAFTYHWECNLSRRSTKRKKLFSNFFLAKKFEIDYVFFFEHRSFFLPARTDLMNKTIAAAFWRKRGIFCAAARHSSLSLWRGLVTPYLTRSDHVSAKLSTAVDNFVRNFSRPFLINFKMLTGEYHG